MDYVGEHLRPGRLGNFFIQLSVVASLFATLAYCCSTVGRSEQTRVKWKKLARSAFLTEVFSVLAVLALLCYILYHHLFEYHYAWQHSSRSLEAKYLFASLWEGQEGSFLLWSFWHCVLGLLLLRIAKSWEAPVMAILSFCQCCLATMLWGISVFGQKIGSNPFALLRNTIHAPLFSRPDYLSFIKDGNDLNPLLQNYWMVIHPPVLFLGFASAILPFSYAMAGLWTKRHTEWTRPALPWALFCMAALGTGILMGARWAYESLTFGGYWAWDPVENASLAPWLVLVAGLHTLLVYKHTGHSLRSAYVFFMLAYLLVLYSTFLTRSGILGDSSVHAFTNTGRNGQVLLFFLLFSIPSAALLIRRYRRIPHGEKDEKTSSREFWMFMGSLLFLLAALSVIAMTSIPVLNHIVRFFKGSNASAYTPLAAGEDAEYQYARIQIWVAMVTALLTAVTHYLKYRQTSFPFLWKRIARPTLVALLLSTLFFSVESIAYDKHGSTYLVLIWITVFFALYAAVANLAYIGTGLKGRLKGSGGAVTHFGFACLLLGILLSSTKKQTLSKHPVSAAPLSLQEAGENLTLVKGAKTGMNNFWVSYESDSVHPQKPLWYYTFRFESKNGKPGFTLTPSAFVNYKGNEGLMSNPAVRHFWGHDLFVYLTSLPNPAKNKTAVSYPEKEIRVKDTVAYPGGFLVLEKILARTGLAVAGLYPSDTTVIATIRLFPESGPAQLSHPILINRHQQRYGLPDTVKPLNLVIELKKVKNDRAVLKISQPAPRFAAIKVLAFPFINLLWAGGITMIAGLAISMRNRMGGRKKLVRTGTVFRETQKSTA